MFKKVLDTLRGGFQKGSSIAKGFVSQLPGLIHRGLSTARQIQDVSSKVKRKVGQAKEIYDKHADSSEGVERAYKRGNEYIDNVSKSADAVQRVGSDLLGLF